MLFPFNTFYAISSFHESAILNQIHVEDIYTDSEMPFIVFLFAVPTYNTSWKF